MKPSAFTLVALALSSCTGFSLGEQGPGDGIHSWIEGGAIAVDPRTETSFVLAKSSDATRKALFAIPADGGAPRNVADLSGVEDTRILFSSSGVLLMTEQAGGERLRIFDPTSFAKTREATSPVVYAGTRLSPSGRYLAVADNSHAKGPIHVIDCDTLAIHPIPHGGDWLEAMFVHGADRLLSIVFYDSPTDPYARILSWNMPDVAAASFAVTAEGYWSSPDFDIRVDGATEDFLFSFTWVGISPDDRTAVFPVLRKSGSGDIHQLLVVDLANGELRTVDDAKGPVGFTPDSASIVSYRQEDVNGQVQSDLLVIDRTTLAVHTVPLSTDGIGPSYFVSHEGNFVVVAPVLGTSRLVLYDVDHDTSTTLAGPTVQLDEFVSRRGHAELWLVDRGLYRLDFYGMSLESIDTGWIPEHINILPRHDLLVLDEAGTPTLRMFDPTTRRVVRSVPLPAL